MNDEFLYLTCTVGEAKDGTGAASRLAGPAGQPFQHGQIDPDGHWNERQGRMFSIESNCRSIEVSSLPQAPLA